MDCPHCGAHVNDGALYCPVCHYALGVTQKIPVAHVVWCQHCGAVIDAGATHCPKCGAPAPALAQKPEPIKREYRDLQLPRIEVEPATSTTSAKASEKHTSASDTTVRSSQERGRTSTEPRIESAIPDAEGSYLMQRSEGMPRTKVFLLAAATALVLVGGGVLLITHPWDPYGSTSKGGAGVDWSQNPTHTTITELKGQDVKEDSADDNSSDDASDEADDEDPSRSHTGDVKFDALMDAWTDLATYRESIAKGAVSLKTDFASDLGTRKASYSDITNTAMALSNTISELDDLKVSDIESYDESKQELMKIANWLRNSCDAVRSSWKLAVNSNDAEGEKNKIFSPYNKVLDAQGNDVYLGYFDEAYEGAKPTQQT